MFLLKKHEGKTAHYFAETFKMNGLLRLYERKAIIRQRNDEYRQRRQWQRQSEVPKQEKQK